MKVNKLDPCPLCGGMVWFNYNLNLEPVGIICRNCNYILRFYRITPIPGEKFEVIMQRLAEAWNRRVGSNEAKRNY